MLLLLLTVTNNTKPRHTHKHTHTHQSLQTRCVEFRRNKSIEFHKTTTIALLHCCCYSICFLLLVNHKQNKSERKKKTNAYLTTLPCPKQKCLKSVLIPKQFSTHSNSSSSSETAVTTVAVRYVKFKQTTICTRTRTMRSVFILLSVVIVCGVVLCWYYCCTNQVVKKSNISVQIFINKITKLNLIFTHKFFLFQL